MSSTHRVSGRRRWVTRGFLRNTCQRKFTLAGCIGRNFNIAFGSYCPSELISVSSDNIVIKNDEDSSQSCAKHRIFEITRTSGSSHSKILEARVQLQRGPNNWESRATQVAASARELACSLSPSSTARPAARMSAPSPPVRMRSLRTELTHKRRTLLGVCAAQESSRRGIQNKCAVSPTSTSTVRTRATLERL